MKSKDDLNNPVDPESESDLSCDDINTGEHDSENDTSIALEIDDFEAVQKSMRMDQGLVPKRLHKSHSLKINVVHATNFLGSKTPSMGMGKSLVSQNSF